MGINWMDTICRTGVLIICAQVLIHFRPDSTYEKYMKMLVSAMILLQLFLPVSNLFTGTGEKSLEARVAWFEEEINKRMEQAALEYEQAVREEERSPEAEQKNAEPIRITPTEKIEIHVGGEQEGEADGESSESGEEMVLPR